MDAAVAEGATLKLADAEASATRASPMQHPAWTKACSDVFYPNRTLRRVETSGGVAVFAPSRIMGQLLLPGAEETGEPVDFDYRNAEGARSLAAAVLALKAPLCFGHFPADSAFLAPFLDGAKGRGRVVSKTLAPSPVIAIDASFADPVSRLNSGRRSDFRRMERIAREFGEATFSIVAPKPAELSALLDEAIAVEARSWKGRAGTSLSHDLRQQRFLRRYAELAAGEGLLRIAMMRLGGESAAVQIAVEYAGAFWLLKIGYDEKFARSSPGNLLMARSIAYAAERGLASYELLGEDAPFTRMWTQEARPRLHLRYYPYNAAGAAALAADAAALALRRMRAKPDKLRP